MWKLEALGMFVHFIIFISVFDIHFRSQISKGKPMNCSGPPLANRLVFILLNSVGTNLFYNHTSDSVLHTKMKTGVWGSSLALVPVLSKHSIISMTGGFQENPLSFTILNPEHEFDHIFNYASKTYFFGDSETIKYFGKSSKTWRAKVVLNSENKTDNIITQVIETFQEPKENKNLHEEGLIFFITLPGLHNSIGTTGGFSQSSLNTIKNLLVKIEYLIKTTENFYKDNKTAFILCSDHGNIKNEGKKEKIDEDSRKAVFMAWGSGVNVSNNVQIDQKDICVFASALLGNPIPLSSTGSWPKGCLNLSNADEAISMACNAFHLASMAQLAREDEEFDTIKYKHLLEIQETLAHKQHSRDLKNFLEMGKYDDVKELSIKLTNTSLKIIEKDIATVKNCIYYLINATFIGWMMFLLSLLISNSLKKRIEERIRLKMLRKKIEPWLIGFNTLIILIIIGSILIVLLQGWPLYYIGYSIVPLLLWRDVLNDIQKWSSFIEKLTAVKLFVIIMFTLLYVVSTEAVVWGLKYKQILSFNMITVTVFITFKSILMKKGYHIIAAWVSSALFLIFFINMPLMDTNLSPVTLNASALIWPISCAVCAYNMRRNILDFIVTVFCTSHYIASLVLVNMNIFYPHESLEFVPLILIGTGLLLPFIGGINITNRLQQIATCLSSILLAFSVSYEPIIIYAIFVHSFSWYLLSQVNEKTKSLSRYNSYHAIIFTVLICAVKHIMNINNETFPIILIYMPTKDIIKSLLVLLKLYIIVYLIFTNFRAIASRSGGDSQFILVNLQLSLCAYRFFLETTSQGRNEDFFLKHIKNYCFIEIIQFLLLMTYSLTKIVLHASILKLRQCTADIIYRLRDITFA